MHHKLDIRPIPENVLYINELSLAAKVPYETKQETEKALTGKLYLTVAFSQMIMFAFMSQWI